MAETSAEVKLKLILDVLNAQQNAAAMTTAMDSTAKSAKRAGQEMEQALGTKLVKATVGVLRDNYETLANEEIPEIFRRADLAKKLIDVTALDETSKFLQQAVLRAAQGPELRGQRAAFGALQQIQGAMGGVPMSQEQVNAMAPILMNEAMGQESARRSLAGAFSNWTGSLPPPDVATVAQRVFWEGAAAAGTITGATDPRTAGGLMISGNMAARTAIEAAKWARGRG